jgi:hypothetical protein
MSSTSVFDISVISFQNRGAAVAATSHDLPLKSPTRFRFGVKRYPYATNPLYSNILS